MKAKIRFLSQIILCCYLVILVSGNFSIAFSSDSFFQKVGDGFIWEVKNADVVVVGPEVANLGDRLKVEITVAESSCPDCCGHFGDVLYGNMYNNSLADRIWTLFETDNFFAVYNKSTGYFGSSGQFFIPHNETVVNSTMYITFTSDWHYQTYEWIGGSHGYDGLAYGFNGSVTGDVNESKKEYGYNVDGVLQYYKEYNGTGSDWDLIYHIELIDSYSAWDPIPLIIIISSVTICCIGLYLFWDYKKKSKKIKQIHRKPLRKAVNFLSTF